MLHSTIRPATTKKVAELAADKRVNVIDACMTAVPSVVRQGGLTFLVGGQKAFFERAKPHLLNMAKDAVHMGPLGCGNVTKLFKNMVTASEALIVYEALQIAKAGGVSYKAALDLMKKTKSQHILDRWETRYDISGGELKFNPGTNLYDKDLPLAADVGKALGADIPGGGSVGEIGHQVERRKGQHLKKDQGGRIKDESREDTNRRFATLHPSAFILHPFFTVRIKTYRGHRVELDSDKVDSREWIAERPSLSPNGKKEKRIPIFGRRRGTFDTQRQADAYALELAKLWIDGRTWGTNGHG